MNRNIFVNLCLQCDLPLAKRVAMSASKRIKEENQVIFLNVHLPGDLRCAAKVALFASK